MNRLEGCGPLRPLFVLTGGRGLHAPNAEDGRLARDSVALPAEDGLGCEFFNTEDTQPRLNQEWSDRNGTKWNGKDWGGLGLDFNHEKHEKA